MIFLMARTTRGTREEGPERNWYQTSFSDTSFLLRDYYSEMALGGASVTQYRNTARATLLVVSRSLI